MDSKPGDKPRRYFDWAATAVPDARPLRDTEEKSFFGNPSSLHVEGRAAREALENARSRCAAVLGVPPENIVFTSGGTESNTLVIHSLLLRPQKAGILYSAAEHPSIRENCVLLERLGFSSLAIDVESDGRASAETIAAAVKKNPRARFAAVMAVNNETGSVTDMKAVSAALREREGAPVHFHSDLVQAAGKIPLDIKGWDLDSAAISAHKLGGPRGVGLLYLKKPLESFYSGGGQERKIRPGTENVAGAAALADCLLRRASKEALESSAKEAAFRMTLLLRGLKKNPRCVLVPEDRGEDDPRFSPWIVQARFLGIPGEVMVRALDAEGFAVSTGSACSSSSPERPVLRAMGLDAAARLEGIRVSQGWTTSPGDIEALLAGIEKTAALL